jgi:hypothetical protein
MFEVVVIGICLCVGYTITNMVEWCVTEIKKWYVGHSK